MVQRQITGQTLLHLELAAPILLSVIKAVTPERTGLTYKVTTRQQTMVPTTITILLVVMLTVSQVQQALELATIPLMPITTELVEPSILGVAVVNTILTAEGTRYMCLRDNYKKIDYETY